MSLGQFGPNRDARRGGLRLRRVSRSPLPNGDSVVPSAETQHAASLPCLLVPLGDGPALT
jgi:hypothetical protein